jgi:hypothetical protein
MCIVDEVHNWKSGESNNANGFKENFAPFFNKNYSNFLKNNLVISIEMISIND